MTGLEQLQREVRDLRHLAVGLQRRGREPDEVEQFTLGAAFVRAALVALAHGIKRNDLVEQFKAVTSPAMLSVPNWAGELGASSVGSFILGLASGSRAFAQIAARAHGFQISANLRAVALDTNATAAFYAEADSIGMAQAKLLANSLRPYTVKALVEATEELAERTDAESVLRDLLTKSIGDALEGTFFGTAAASTAAPAGVLSGKTSLSPGQSFSEDASALAEALDNPADIVFVCSPSRRVALASVVDLPAFGYAVYGSSGVPSDRLVALDCDRVAIGIGGMSHKTGFEATVIEDSEPPNDLLTGSPVRSLWQTDVISLKSTLGVSWAVAANGAAFVQPIAW